MLRPLLCSLVLTPWLLAQSSSPSFAPKAAMIRVRADEVGKLLEQLPKTTAGKLLANPEVASAFAAGLRSYRDAANRGAAVLAAVRASDMELDPWMASNLAAGDAWAAIRTVELADMQRIELCAVGLDAEQASRFNPMATVGLVTCHPRAEGKWTAIFERIAQQFAKSKQWHPAADVKFGGFPVHAFQLAKGGDANVQILGDSGERSIWMLHLPGTFAFGDHAPETTATPTPSAPSAGPLVLGEMDLEAYMAVMSPLLGQVPREFTALGFDGLKMLRWRARFLGASVLEEWEVQLNSAPKGLVGALLAGKAVLPAQPLPDGALAQIRCGLDVAVLRKCLDDLGASTELPAELLDLAAKALTGGVALGASAPATGGVIPRLYLSLGIADAKALDTLLDKALPGDGARKKVTYEGVECSVLTLPGLPAAVQPTFCRLDGVLHVAESALSMRAFLKARAKGGDAIDVSALPEPPGEGEVLPTFDVRCDEQALYATYHKVWLPLVKLIPFGDQMKPLLTADDMPSPDAVVPLLGKSRGVLRRQDKTYRLQQLGALGGVEMAALAMTWGPIVSSTFHRDYTTDTLRSELARHQLDRVWPALEAFQKANKRWPNDLGELFVAAKLPADALLLPGDDRAEAVAMPAGDGRVVKSSFRYWRNGVKVDVQGNEKTILLIEITPHPWRRAMLADDGQTPDTYGAESSKPIDEFGK